MNVKYIMIAITDCWLLLLLLLLLQQGNNGDLLLHILINDPSLKSEHVLGWILNCHIPSRRQIYNHIKLEPHNFYCPEEEEDHLQLISAH